MKEAGVFAATRKDGSIYYRSSVTYKSKHISLGSFDSPQLASAAYNEAKAVLNGINPLTGAHVLISDIISILLSQLNTDSEHVLPFDKQIILINFRDNGIYFKTPIYLLKKYFLYFLTPQRVLKFDANDLFYYSTHTIMTRSGYLFVNDYGMQTNILSRYGIRNHAVCGRDYSFVNGDTDDFRYGNLTIINRYHGVQLINKNGIHHYKVKIHVKGDFVVGTYSTEKEAAIAYNKAADLLSSKKIGRNYPSNYVEDVTPIEYARIYNSVRISKKLLELS